MIQTSETVVHLEPKPAEPHVVIQMEGPDIVVRASEHVGRDYTESLADVLNAASDSDTWVVIDPEPIRFDGAFDAYRADGTGPCPDHQRCQPLPAEVIASGVVRIRAERTSWFIDVARGRFCRVDPDVDVRFLAGRAWSDIVAVCVTPTRLVALEVGGGLVSARRAHGAA